MDVRVALKNCGVGEDSWESLGSVLNIHWVDWCWSWSFNNLATWCEEQTHLKRPRCWERLKAGEGADRGWDSWTASQTQWTWARINSQRWWRTEKPGVLQSLGSQRFWHDWATELIYIWNLKNSTKELTYKTNIHKTNFGYQQGKQRTDYVRVFLKM